MVVLRRHKQRRVAFQVHVVHGGVGRALEDHPHDVRVPLNARHYERRVLVGGGVEVWPAQVEWRATRRQQPAHRRGVAANASLVQRRGAESRHRPSSSIARGGGSTWQRRQRRAGGVRQGSGLGCQVGNRSLTT